MKKKFGNLPVCKPHLSFSGRARPTKHAEVSCEVLGMLFAVHTRRLQSFLASSTDQRLHGTCSLQKRPQLGFFDPQTEQAHFVRWWMSGLNYFWCQWPFNCISRNTPGLCIINEKIFPTKACCPFLLYIATKHDKFGIAADLKQYSISKATVLAEEYYLTQICFSGVQLPGTGS